MISNLEDLLAPLTVGEFRKALRERAFFFRRGEGVNRFANLLDWATLRHIVEDGIFPAADVRIMRASKLLSALVYLDGKKVNAEKLATLMRNGASLITQPINAYVPALHALCENIRRQVADYVWAGAVAQTGSGGALTIHYDPEDLIILQLEGTKRWRIFSPTVTYPVAGAKPLGLPSENLVLDEVLRPGDLMFLPAGFWHVCENGPDLSLHGVLFFRASTALLAANSLFDKLKEDVAFRAPLTRFETAAERAIHEQNLKARLIAQIEATSFDELLAGFVPNKSYDA
jgi:ribosomal protein L16 Arg81 hydroxylase